ncbi:MAG: GDYXXLXY domain-containing protein [Nanoarchaeota archaeon]|nr:GDYXXLXY domain-containing protein [Nanoarchaeota archaeon]
MNKNYTKLIIFITILILGFAIAMLYLSWPRLTGKTIVLRTTPVDPFDILRGQYMTIRYEISSVNINDLSEGDIGKSIYIILKKDNDFYTMSSYSFDKPESGDFIKGKIEGVNGNNAVINYGIEQYFFERGAYVPQFNQVEVKVSSSGAARINRLLINGEEIVIKYRDKEWTS